VVTITFGFFIVEIHAQLTEAIVRATTIFFTGVVVKKIFLPEMSI
jgi:hypothetical protein